jgi:hypothetical protein
MSKLEKIVEEPVAPPESEEAAAQPKISGIVFRPIDAEKAMQLLDHLNDLGIEEPVALSEAEAQQPIHLKASGLSIRPINVEAALRALDSLCEGDPEEQRETFEYLKRALNETRAANGERLLFPDEDVSGIVLPPFNPAGAIAVLQSFYDGDPEEQRETFEYLKQALNEDRAAGGERLLFPDE